MTSERLGVPPMRVLFVKSRRGRWLAWTAIPAVIGLGALALSSLGSSQSDQAPPPVKTGKSGAAAFPARDQP